MTARGLPAPPPGIGLFRLAGLSVDDPSLRVALPRRFVDHPQGLAVPFTDRPARFILGSGLDHTAILQAEFHCDVAEWRIHSDEAAR